MEGFVEKAAAMTSSEPDMGHGRPSDRPAVFVSTGCTSSDMMLAPVLARLQDRGVVGEITGVGGAPLRELGVRLYYDPTLMSSVGILYAARNLMRDLSSAYRAYRQVKKAFRKHPPALVVLVDNAGLNLRVLRLARLAGIPVVYFVPPESWSIWRKDARAIARGADHIVPIFAKEGAFYASLGGQVTFLGHPLVDILGGEGAGTGASPVAIASRPTASVGDDGPTIGLFPGSRTQEIEELLHVLRDAVAILHQQIPNARFVACSANEMAQRRIRAECAHWPTPVELVHRQSRSVLARCDLLLTCSGTATLEAAVLDVPMVAMYRMTSVVDHLVRWLVLPFRKYPFFALPNYLLGRELIPELHSQDANGERIAAEGLSLLRDATRRAKVRAGYAEIRKLLGPPGAIRRTAELIEAVLREGRRDGASAGPKSIQPAA